MNRILSALAPFVFVTAAAAVEVDPRLDRAIHEALPVCKGATVALEELPMKLPARFKGAMVKVESANHACDGQYAAVLAPSGNVFVGMPWVIERSEGTSIEEKLKNFSWRNLQANMIVTVDRKLSEDGLYPVTLTQVVEAGRMPMHGMVDPEGRIFFFGQFRKGEARAARLKAFESALAKAPARGPAAAPVTLVEFSDFQCPSCARSAGIAESILSRFDGKVRYSRSDLPLTGHAWAFPAAVAGRAIHRQKPDLFWAYKTQVYDNQPSLNAFVFWDWARGFAEDNGLDLARYDADIASEEIRSEILEAAGLAFSYDVGATPTFMVNGAMVNAGQNGADLMAYIESLLK
ncbi:MAG TPA: thioredoxin domain-containing protein [Thermoanaerobaculia bacterium]